MSKFTGKVFKEHIQNSYSEFNKTKYEFECELLKSYEKHFRIPKLCCDSWVMKIVDTFRILIKKKDTLIYKVKEIAEELEKNFTNEYLQYMIDNNINWKNSLNSYFTKSKLFIQVNSCLGKGYWTLYDQYYTYKPCFEESALISNLKRKFDYDYVFPYVNNNVSFICDYNEL